MQLKNGHTGTGGHFHRQLQKQYAMLLRSFLLITTVLLLSGIFLFRHIIVQEALKTNAAAWKYEIEYSERSAARFLDTVQPEDITGSAVMEKLEHRMYILDRMYLSTAKLQILDSDFRCIASNTGSGYYGMLYHLLKNGGYDGQRVLLSIGRHNSTVLVKKIADCWLLLFIDFTRIENKLAQLSHFAVLVNRHNTIAATNMETFKHQLKCSIKDGYFSAAPYRYAVCSFVLPADYRLIAFEKENSMIHVLLFSGSVILCIMLVLFALGKIMTGRLVQENTKELHLLLHAIENISNPSQFLSLNGNSEFALIADNINKLLHSIEDLHIKNEQLLYISMEREMRLLEASFNPHFIYNTLDAIKYLMFIDKKKSADMLQLFSEVLRYSLNTHSTVIFDEDLYYIEQFLLLHTFRLEENFTYSIEVPDNFRRMILPKLFLQPLIENSLKYGFKEQKKLHIVIRCREISGYFIFEVADTGLMLSEQDRACIEKLITKKENPTGHIGLYMTARLVKLYFGEQSYVRFESAETGNVCSIYVYKGAGMSEKLLAFSSSP